MSAGGDVADLTCREALARLYEFLDGELEPASSAEVEHHFEVCARCWPHLAMERSFREAVRRALAGQRAPAGLRGRVEAVLAAEGGGRG